MTTRMMVRRIWNWRHFLKFHRMVISGVLFVSLAVGGLLAMRALRPAAPIQILPGQTLAWDIARSASNSEGVQIASGAYLPGDRLVLYTRTSQTDRAHIRSWALAQLEPFADRFATLSANEKLTWIIDFGPAPGEQETITAPLRKAADPSYYQYVSAIPGLLADTTLSQAVPTPAAQPEVTIQPTTAAVTSQLTSTSTLSQTAQQHPDTIPAEGAPLLTTAFDDTSKIASEWLPLSGSWVSHDGIYSQNEINGYDFISMLNLEPQTHYHLQAKLRLGEGDMGGGFVYNAPSQTTRTGAHTIDFDNKGGFLRWGRYDDKGAYVYEGGVKLPTPINDGKWHTLSVVTHATTSVVSLDGQPMGTITNTSADGYVGLLSSKTQVDFDDVEVTLLPETSNGVLPPAVTATPVTSTSFRDTFDDGDAKGWTVMNGAWQVIDGTYQQTSTTGFDLGSVSLFQGANFTATVRLKRLEGDMGAGLFFNMSERTSKNRSQMINFTQGGTAVQWGYFDEGGNFVFQGSSPVSVGNDDQWHTLGLNVRDGKATFTLDGKEVARDVALTYTNGYVGLLASSSKIAFDTIQIEPQ